MWLGTSGFGFWEGERLEWMVVCIDKGWERRRFAVAGWGVFGGGALCALGCGIGRGWIGEMVP